MKAPAHLTIGVGCGLLLAGATGMQGDGVLVVAGIAGGSALLPDLDSASSMGTGIWRAIGRLAAVVSGGEAQVAIRQ